MWNSSSCALSQDSPYYPSETTTSSKILLFSLLVFLQQGSPAKEVASSFLIPKVAKLKILDSGQHKLRLIRHCNTWLREFYFKTIVKCLLDATTKNVLYQMCGKFSTAQNYDILNSKSFLIIFLLVSFSLRKNADHI